MYVRPLGNSIIVTYEEPPERSNGGIIIPKPGKKDELHEGVVVSVGKGVLLKDGTYAKPDINIGERVVYNKFGAHGFVRSGIRFVHVQVDYVLGSVD